ncbi:MAG: hypothetical protein B6242_10990 [Anaerolineaceae bacterium 4572_78]|nr:MAG: hypothetical protein B6242_10990 [Anaerolineaceae bacterium 4572_78]
MKKRITQTAKYWQHQFEIDDKVLQSLKQRVRDLGSPLSIDKVCLFFIRNILEKERKTIRSELQGAEPYRPDQKYAVNDKIVFPHWGFTIGKVVSVRPGYNPVDKRFDIIEVAFPKSSDTIAQLAANIKTPHKLLEKSDEDDQTEDIISISQKIYKRYKQHIRPKIEYFIKNDGSFVSFKKNCFLKELLPKIQEGLLNIVDAVIDINGKPMSVDDLIEPLELYPKGKITDASRFSINYYLHNDNRFENVGTPDLVLWYLNRLRPPQLRAPIYHLQVKKTSFNVNVLSGDLRAFLADIDDEVTPIEYTTTTSDTKTVKFTLIYPHLHAGTIPVLPAVLDILPTADSELLILNFIDGQTGETFLGWLIEETNYIFGFENWYKKYNLPVGTLITLKKTENPLELIIDFNPQRRRPEVVTVAKINNDRLTFQMERKRITAKYDELMLFSVVHPHEVERYSNRLEKQGVSLSQLMEDIFPELMQLSPHSAVHVKTLYSAVNIVKRYPPGPIFYELVTHKSFESLGDGYWFYRNM